METKQQQIINGIQTSKGISTMCQSVSRKYIGWAEDTEQAGVITVMDLQNNKKKQMTCLLDATKTYSYISMVFTRDEKQLLTLTAGPDHTLIVWEWNKQKPVNSHSLGYYSLTALFLHPKEDEYCCVIGLNYFRRCKFVAEVMTSKEVIFNTKKDAKDNVEPPLYLSHCVKVDDSLILGTSQGELMQFKLNPNCDFLQSLSTSIFDLRPIEVIIPYSKGFIIGTNNSSVYVYERNEGDTKKPYIKSDKKYIHPDIKAKVTSLLLTINEENLIIGLENG